jgi:tetratricopeptide (TPR) repeat protein
MTDPAQAKVADGRHTTLTEPAEGAPSAGQEQQAAAEAWSEPEGYVRVLSALANGEGAQAIARLEQLQSQPPVALPELAAMYLSGIAHFAALDWAGVVAHLRQYVVSGPSDDWHMPWAYLRLGQALEELGRLDEASLAYRGCLTLTARERLPRQLAFALMSRIADESPGVSSAP